MHNKCKVFISKTVSSFNHCTACRINIVKMISRILLRIKRRFANKTTGELIIENFESASRIAYIVGCDIYTENYSWLNFRLGIVVFNIVTYLMINCYSLYHFWGDLLPVAFCLVTFTMGFQVRTAIKKNYPFFLLLYFFRTRVPPRFSHTWDNVNFSKIFIKKIYKFSQRRFKMLRFPRCSITTHCIARSSRLFSNVCT